MPHITNEDLAKGIIDVASIKDRTQLRNKLVEGGTAIAVEFACQLVEDKTGLPRSVCKPVAQRIVKDLRKAIGERFRS